MSRIAIVDDEPALTAVLTELCRSEGHETRPFCAPQAAVDKLEEFRPDVLLCDMKFDNSPLTGLDVLQASRERLPGSRFILVTGHDSMSLASRAMRLGAFACAPKPFVVSDIVTLLNEAVAAGPAADEGEGRTAASGAGADAGAAAGRGPRAKRPAGGDEAKRTTAAGNAIIGQSAAMRSLYSMIGRLVSQDTRVLITGESGTGKELVARALHYEGSRAKGPFVAINCSAIPENLLESELFGHVKGSFTGAVQDKIGLFQEAENGTVFLDEVNSMPMLLQAKLLRVLQEKTVRRVGDTKTTTINARVVAASNESLEERIRAGLFREDLYYRLNVVPLPIPALRERPEDIPLLAAHFLEKMSARTGEKFTMSEEAMEILCRYGWPGNVRELENAVENACCMTVTNHVSPCDLPRWVLGQLSVFRNQGPDALAAAGISLEPGQRLDDFNNNNEGIYIRRVLDFNEGSREKTASMLGISMATLYRKLDLGKDKERLRRNPNGIGVSAA